MTSAFNIVLRYNEGSAEEEITKSLQETLISNPLVSKADFQDIHLVGATSKETLGSLALAFATSVAANFATEAIKDIIKEKGLEGEIDVVTCVPQEDAPEPEISTEPRGLPQNTEHK